MDMKENMGTMFEVMGPALKDMIMSNNRTLIFDFIIASNRGSILPNSLGIYDLKP